jgi:hypothetical protein
MSRQLDILAIEPYHGGPRRAMLEALARHSRHRWRIMKLPPRKMHRRLLVSSLWFAETLSRNGLGNVDLLFCSEALNLADFLRLAPPALARRPSVVYFHENQLPEAGDDRPEKSTDLVNLNSAMAAHEIWFNSVYHLRTFLSRASGMVARHEELQMRSPMPSLMAKAHLMPPPIDFAEIEAGGSKAPAGPRDPRAVLFDARGADCAMVLAALHSLLERGERIKLTVIGKLKGLPPALAAEMIDERNIAAHARALHLNSLLVSARPDAPCDDLTLQALAADCHAIVPATGVYPELLPEPLHELCMHDGTAESLAARIMDAWYTDRPRGLEFLRDEILSPFDAIHACKVIDERLDNLAGGASKRMDRGRLVGMA